MVTALAYLLILVNGVVSLAAPWIGITIAYLFALMTPQNIWFWAFEGIRPFFMIVVPALIGFGLAVLFGKVQFRRIATRLNAYLFVMWLFMTLAYYVGPYVDVVNAYRFFDPTYMFETLQKTFLTYFIATVLIDNDRKLKAAALVMVVTVAYLTWWTNAQYLFEGQWGRIQGPRNPDGHGIYADENIFSTVFVVGIPFLYYLGRYLDSRLLRWAVWAVIPLAWHAIFLTASRGALVGVAATLALFVLRSERKFAGVLAVAAFVGAFVWQAGEVMTERATTIGEYQEDTSATGRIEAWEAAAGMMAAHPITGVGFSSFGQAFPSFSNAQPRIAHNTIFQIGAEWGLIALTAYLLLMFSTLNRLRRNGKQLLRGAQDERAKFLFCLNEATLIGLFGLFTCSMFLSLEAFELFYYLLFLANAVLLASAAEPVAQPGTATRARAAPAAWRGAKPQPAPLRAATERKGSIGT